MKQKTFRKKWFLVLSLGFLILAFSVSHILFAQKLTSTELLNVIRTSFKPAKITSPNPLLSGEGKGEVSPVVKVASPVITQSALITALRTLLNDPNIANQLRGPQGIQGLQGPSGALSSSPSNSQIQFNICLLGSLNPIQLIISPEESTRT